MDLDDIADDEFHPRQTYTISGQAPPAQCIGRVCQNQWDARTPFRQLLRPDLLDLKLSNAVNAVLGIPNGFNNLGLQAALYENAPADQMGAAGGQVQTFRYVGAILSTSLLGLVFGTTVSSAGLHSLAYILAVISGFVLVASLMARGPRRAREASRPPPDRFSAF